MWTGCMSLSVLKTSVKSWEQNSLFFKLTQGEPDYDILDMCLEGYAADF